MISPKFFIFFLFACLAYSSSALDDGFGNTTANKDVDNDGVFNNNEVIDAFFEAFNSDDSDNVTESKAIKMSIAQNLSSSTFPSHYIDNIDSDQQDINGTTAAISREVPKNETNSKLESLGTTQISPSKNVSHIGEVVTSLPNYTNETTSTTKSTTTATDFQFDQETTNFFNRSGTISSTKSTKSFPPHTPQTTTTIMPSTHSTTTTSSPNKAKTTTTTVKPDTDDGNFARTNFGNIFLITIILFVQIIYLKF